MSGNVVWGDDWDEIRRLWALDPTVAHCNHGSFGAVPAPVVCAQEAFRGRMVANPARWFGREMPELVTAARAEVARFLRAQPDDVAFTTNVSSGISAVLQSLSLDADAEVLSTNHAYGAVSLALERLCARTGATSIVAPVPVDSNDTEVIGALAERTSPRTRLVVIDHITSATARRFPVGAVAALAHSVDAAILVDGAHAPGMLDLDVPAIGADFWVGNLHKWPCAPAGTGVLWVTPAWRDRLRPLVVSHAEHDGFPTSFERAGTNDHSAWLAAPAALRLLASLGWGRVREHNETLVRCGQRTVADILGIPAERLRHDPGLSMAIVPLPPGLADDSRRMAVLHEHMQQLGVELATPIWNGRGTVRLSAHVYNRPADYERLAIGIRDLMVA